MQIGSHTRMMLPCSGDKALSTKSARALAVSVSRQIESGSEAPDSVSEKELFIAMNTCAYQANKTGNGNARNGSASSPWQSRWKLIRDFIVQKNLGLAYSTVTRYWRRQSEWEEARSAGLIALFRAVGGYDPGRGVKFSTYACTAIRRATICADRTTQTFQFRFQTNQEVSNDHIEQEDRWQALFIDRLQHILEDNSCELTKRELDILEWRFPSSGIKARTLSEIGRFVGVSKERIRQIEKSALIKLRAALDADPNLQ